MPTHTAEKEVEIADRVSWKLARKWRLRYGRNEIVGVVWAGIHKASQKGVADAFMARAGILHLIDQMRSEKTNEGHGRCRKSPPKVVSLSAVVEWGNDIQDRSSTDHPTNPLLAGWCRTSHLRRELSWAGRVALYLIAVEGMRFDEAAACLGRANGGCFWDTVNGVRRGMREMIKKEGL